MISLATTYPYRAHDIVFNQITTLVTKGKAAVDFSAITVLITASGEPLNKIDMEQPRRPSR
jgi:hypothetical protein